MDIETTGEPPTQHHATEYKAGSSAASKSRVDSSKPAIPIPVARQARNGAIPARSEHTAKQISNGPKPLSNNLANLPLIDRISSLANASFNAKAVAGGSVSFGGHSISLNGSMTNSASTPLTMEISRPKGKVKKGPRRLAKLEARKQWNSTALPAVPSTTIQANGMASYPPPRPKAVDLDAEMEEYRRAGLMGLGGPHR